MARIGTKPEILALAIARGCSVTVAARKAGIGRRTAYHWLESEDFQRRISALRDDMTKRALGVLVGSVTFAAARLRALAESKDESIALRASQAILDQANHIRETVDISQRLTELEARINADRSRTHPPVRGGSAA